MHNNTFIYCHLELLFITTMLSSSHEVSNQALQLASRVLSKQKFKPFCWLCGYQKTFSQEFELALYIKLKLYSQVCKTAPIHKQMQDTYQNYQTGALPSLLPSSSPPLSHTQAGGKGLHSSIVGHRGIILFQKQSLPSYEFL